MKNKSKGILHRVEKFSVSVVLTRLIAFAMSIYFILNFKDDQNFYGIILLFLGFVICIATTLGIEIKQYNLLNVFTKRKFIRHKTISNVVFIPSEFSATIFLLNGLIRSGINSNKESVIKIKMEDGTEIELKNIGNKLDVASLNKIILENK